MSVMNRSASSLLAISAFLILSEAAMAKEPAVFKALNDDPNPGPVGEMPYEMAGREEERAPLVDFQNLDGWIAEGWDAEGKLFGSREQRLYRDKSAKLVYKGTSPLATLLVRPEKPIPIPEPWDCVNFWNYGNAWCWVQESQPWLLVSVVVRDAAGKQYDLPMGVVDYEYWHLMHSRFRGSADAVKRPLEFVGVRLTNAGGGRERKFFLGPICFYKEELKPLTFEPWPEKLPFPTREETILPSNKVADFKNSASKEDATTVFRYEGSDCVLEYAYAPKDGTLGDIETRFNGKRVRPCAGGGAALPGSHPGDPSISRRLKSQSLDNNVLKAVWELKKDDISVNLEYCIRIRQKSLIVEIAADNPAVEAMRLGRAEGVASPKIFKIPYLTYGGNDAYSLYADGLFYFCQFDWYVSDASELYGGGSVGKDWAVYNGGAAYNRKTDGMRNPVRERLFINVSPDFQETLPTIANPPSPMKEAQGDRLWRVKGGNNYAAELAEVRQRRNYGCEKVSIRYHEDFWRDGGESFTFRLNAAPKAGGDEAVRRFVADVKDLGWRVGLYTNYTDFSPVNSFWSEDWVSRSSDGDWMRAWCRCYAPKPMISVKMEAELAPKIQEKFGENHSYCDVHTAVSPFSRVDYDARVPEAGKFRRTFECYGRLLYNEKFAHNGPVYSEGNNHWWYAGLTDGNYAQIISNAPPKEPMLVDFDLLKMHPLNMDAGMGAPGMFFRSGPYDLDQFIATTIAYGHIGYLDWSDFASELKIYYMIQQIQKRYAMVPVSQIEYEHNGEMLDTSRALASGAYRKGRIHVTYENGTEVFVNGSDESWKIAGPEQKFELPKWGYAAWRKEDGLLAYSAIVPAGGAEAESGARRRMDFCAGTDQFYADSRGGFAFLGPLAVEGSGALKKDGDTWRVIPTVKFAEFAFDPALAGIDPDRDVDLMGVDADGNSVDAPKLRWSRGLLHVIPSARDNVLKYNVRPLSRRRPAHAHCPEVFAAPGGEVTVGMPPGCSLLGNTAVWTCGGKEWISDVSLNGDALSCRLPSGAAEGEHVWLRIPAQPATLWIDFIARNAFETSIVAPAEAYAGPGKTVKIVVKIRSNLQSTSAVRMRLKATGGAACLPHGADLHIEAMKRKEIVIDLAPPEKPGDFSVTAVVQSENHESVAKADFSSLTAQRAIADLMSPEVPLSSGRCVRGGAEIEGFAETTDGSFERSRGSSGGVELDCLFSHPPYAPGGVGYSFGVFKVDLPKDVPAALTFKMGMRDGLNPSDGVTFKVVALEDDGRETALFERHYKDVKWTPAEADLSAFAGKSVRLKLIADCGPNDDTTADHALWGEPAIRSKEKCALVRRK
ncbi:MAG TPA: hypothetical protein PL033_11300 [Candidatus Brocadiia bacterium]|nr:hypothetical protein [Candidatus Brocadiia bacterium]